jgi:hypothetical protein
MKFTVLILDGNSLSVNTYVRKYNNNYRFFNGSDMNHQKVMKQGEILPFH